MKMRSAVLALSVAVAFAGCLSDPEGSRCNPDHTCGGGLACDETDHCVRPPGQSQDAGGDEAGADAGAPDAGATSGCGDGKLEGTEACDDNNGAAGDGCSQSCAIEAGFTCAGTPSVCQKCGNARREGTEACDDGNGAPGDGCSTSCAIETGFTCSGTPSVCQKCGNGKVEGTEKCDDANVAPGDGCSATCGLETGFTCGGTPSVCQKCGNGKLEGTEKCDDGNASPGDGCSASCAVESGFTCTGTPSVCQGCGNGKLEGNEKCDDGNAAPLDGCSASCAIETGFTCSGTPSVCACLASKTNCGGTCVDVLSDANHCGACGYKVLRGRTCVAGKPNPGWVPMPNLPAGVTAGGGAMTWTGKKYVAWGAGTLGYAYELATDSWVHEAAYDPPGVTIGGNSALVVMADRKQVFVWPTYSTTLTNAALLLDDSGTSPKWTNVTTTGAPSQRSRPGMEYDGSNVVLMFGNAGSGAAPPEDGGRYNLASQAWTHIGSSGFSCAGYGVKWGAIAASGTSILSWPGMYADGSFCNSNGSFGKLDSNLSWSTPTLKATPWSYYPGWVSTGDKVYKHGGCDAAGNVSGGVLIDLAGGTATAVSQPAGINPGSEPYIAWTGKSVIVWGGSTCNSSGTIVGSQQGGAVGVLSSNSIAWSSLPTFQQPSARTFGGGQRGNTQTYWTGAEFIVFGGINMGTGTLLSDGARYQPPVGCVCPGPAAGPFHSSACDGVTGTIPACAP